MLTFEFTGVRGVMSRHEPLTSGMVGRKVRISFSPEWEELRKIAVFRAGDVIRDVLDPAEEILIPAQVLEKPLNRLYLGIYGINEQGDLVIPTVWAEGPMIEQGASPSGDPSTDPEKPVWEQILNTIGDLKKLSTKNRDNLVDAINEAAASGGSGESTGGGSCDCEEGIPKPVYANVGQVIVVSEVDEQGQVIATAAVDMPAAEVLADAEGVPF